MTWNSKQSQDFPQRGISDLQGQLLLIGWWEAPRRMVNVCTHASVSPVRIPWAHLNCISLLFWNSFSSGKAWLYSGSNLVARSSKDKKIPSPEEKTSGKARTERNRLYPCTPWLRSSKCYPLIREGVCVVCLLHLRCNFFHVEHVSVESELHLVFQVCK